ncbi:HlyD family type I secretion periplasmic adaptor subunit [Phreatobacter sp. AB_2022a]|uniref:HlyD family type I secretion periplasmic adaptor subunit n=1 Tax=Phreatobacter sp. AB_2022a TaxID=3003134 RepID=UPI0022873B8C|nr:HlyD family type I secretion periplasmic adaptor subunit [Phreatobacter sp. AB_2022a]MCZ0733023.1 HlyD family type I secretion periplasmic adaptor subunit [Phreatobacter sp. AB_2022a]
MTGEAVSRPDRVATGGEDRSIARHIRFGLAVAVVLVGGGGVVAATVPIAGAVVAQGTVVVDSNVKTVQHPFGGVIGEIRVRDGTAVREGDLVMRLDDTVTRANLQVVVKQLHESEARRVRLEAERDGIVLTLPPALREADQDGDARRAFDGEIRLFSDRRAARDGQRGQLRERIAQIREEMVGLQAQEAARRRQVELIKRELTDIRALFRQNLVPRTRLVELEREAARLDGEVGQFVAERARAEGRIAEAELQMLQIDQDMRREVSTELREVQMKLGELIERRVAAEDQLKRIDIRAPQSGFVHQLAYHTIGGVVQAGQPIMQVVPGDDRLVIEIRVQPNDIHHVAPGQSAFIRLTAFPQRTTPEVEGRLIRLSADVARDPQNQIPFYLARVAVDETELAKLRGMKIVPGMPAEVFVRTEERTTLSYLMKPLMDQVKRVFREI